MKGPPRRGRAPDPVRLFLELFDRARRSEPADPTAAALATADASGHPSVRMVLLKHVDAGGFVFFTNYESRKARDLDANPRAALCVHWPTLGSQARIEGGVVRVSPSQSDAYFAARPRESQLAAWASRQSAPLASLQDLLGRYEEMGRRFADRTVPRPAFWGGYRLRPELIELWQAGDHRLHHRLCFRRVRGRWRREVLQP